MAISRTRETSRTDSSFEVERRLSRSAAAAASFPMAASERARASRFCAASVSAAAGEGSAAFETAAGSGVGVGCVWELAPYGVKRAQESARNVPAKMRGGMDRREEFTIKTP